VLSPQDIQLQAQKINAFGHSLIKQVYKPDAIADIEKNFDALFSERLAQGRVQSRDYRRYVCKLPIDKAYLEILDNPTIHALLTEVLGEDYVLFNFNSHSSLPGSSNQIMHIDSNDPVNTDTLVHNYANVAFLHIPLIDTDISHGATKMWPATIQKVNNDDLHYYHWVEENLDCSKLELSRGDVIIKLDNCIHAGGKNSSAGRRHILTLIFARKDYYLNNNSGMLPGLSHQDLNLPYRIASHCDKPLESSTDKYTPLAWAKAPTINADAKYAIKAKQYFLSKNAITKDSLTALQSCDLNDANVVMNIFSAFQQAAMTGFGNANFKIHSIEKKKGKQSFGCIDEAFAEAQAKQVQSTINNDNRLVTVRIALGHCDNYKVYPGNKTACSQAINNPEFRNSIEQSLSLQAGDLMVSSGELPFSIDDDHFEYLDIHYTRPEFELNYDKRIWLKDHFALSLPTPLAKKLRYNNIFITEDKYKDFQFSKVSYIFYLTFNYIEQYRMQHKLSGALLKVAAGLGLLPAIIYFATRKTIPNMLAKT